jgi:hypothetical protein
MFLWVPGHSGTQGIEDSDALGKREASKSFLDPGPALLIKQCVGNFKIRSGW